MQAINILDIKQFMKLLFQTDALDAYQFVSAIIQTDMSYALDGHINQHFFNEDELDTLNLNDSIYMPWAVAKEKIFQLIKGKKTPTQLKIVLKCHQDDMNAFLSSTHSSLNSNDIDGFFINILFQENKLNVICGISYKIFTLEKELETEFYANITTLFKQNNIACE